MKDQERMKPAGVEVGVCALYYASIKGALPEVAFRKILRIRRGYDQESFIEHTLVELDPLGLNGRELAELMGVNPSCISRTRKRTKEEQMGRPKGSKNKRISEDELEMQEMAYGAVQKEPEDQVTYKCKKCGELVESKDYNDHSQLCWNCDKEMVEAYDQLADPEPETVTEYIPAVSAALVPGDSILDRLQSEIEIIEKAIDKADIEITDTAKYMQKIKADRYRLYSALQGLRAAVVALSSI